MSILRMSIPVSKLAYTLLSLTLIFAISRSINIGLNRVFVLDEFYYAHQSWLASWSGHGLSELVFKGEHFMPALVYLPFTLLAGNDPGHLDYLRYGALVFLFLGVGLSSYLAYKMNPISRVAAFVCPVLLLSMHHFLKFGSQIRPDMLALALFLITLACLLNQSSKQRWWTVLAAIALMMAVLTSTKAIVYGAGLGLVFFYEILTRKREDKKVFKHPWYFLLACLIGTFAFILFLLMSGELGGFWQGKVQTTLDHQKHYPGISISQFLSPFMKQNFLVLCLSWLGVVLYCYQVISECIVARKLPSGFSLLVIFSWLGAWLSFVLQRAPYPYSLLPVTVFSSIFATYMLCFCAHKLPTKFSHHPRVVVSVVIVFCVIAGLNIYGESKIDRDNGRQVEVLSSIGQLTDANDTIYDMSSSFVFRPHAYHLLIMDRFRINMYKDQVIRDLPQVLKDRETSIFIEDVRFAKNFWDTDLGDHVKNNYVKYNNDIWIWGKKFLSQPDGIKPQESSFYAIKDGEYFVYSVSESSDAEFIEIDGATLKEKVVCLKKGEHQIKHNRASEFYLIWLPRNETPFEPDDEAPPSSLGQFVL